LTPGRRVVLERLVVSQLVKNFRSEGPQEPAIRFYSVQLNTVHPIYLRCVNIILSSVLSLFPLIIQNIVGICKQISIVVRYRGNSKLVFLLISMHLTCRYT
jgi:hypothetical protein